MQLSVAVDFQPGRPPAAVPAPLVGGRPLAALDPQVHCWESDWSGLTADLELEDAESTALGHWLCTGQWVRLVQDGVLQASAPSPYPNATHAVHVVWGVGSQSWAPSPLGTYQGFWY